MENLPPTGRAREPIFSNLPPATAALLALIVGTHLAALTLNPQQLTEALIRYAVIPLRFQPGLPESYPDLGAALAALVGHTLLHGGWLHLAFNGALLLQAGGLAEAGLRRTDRGGTLTGGAVRFVLFYIVCAIGGGLFYVWLNPGGTVPAIGASGAISGIFAGYLWAAYLVLRRQPAGRKAVITQAVVFLVLNVGLAALARVSGLAPIAWEAHLGGFVAGILTFPLFMRLEPRVRHEAD